MTIGIKSFTIWGTNTLIERSSLLQCVSVDGYHIPYMQKFSRYENFAVQQVNRILAIIFLWITGPKFSRFLWVSVARWLQNI